MSSVKLYEKQKLVKKSSPRLSKPKEPVQEKKKNHSSFSFPFQPKANFEQFGFPHFMLILSAQLAFFLTSLVMFSTCSFSQCCIMLPDLELVSLNSPAVFSKELVDLCSDPEWHHLYSGGICITDVY